VVATLASTDIWLFYTTFLDVFIAMVLAFWAINWSRKAAHSVQGLPR